MSGVRKGGKLVNFNIETPSPRGAVHFLFSLEINGNCESYGTQSFEIKNGKAKLAFSGADTRPPIIGSPGTTVQFCRDGIALLNNSSLYTLAISGMTLGGEEE